MTKERISVCDMSADDMETCLMDILEIVMEWRKFDTSANGWMVSVNRVMEKHGLIHNSAEVIDSFRGEHEFLSNFYPASVNYEGRLYPTTEHAFQAAKSMDQKVRESVRRAPTPGQAKKMGNNLKIRRDWESVKYNVMLDVVRKKFQHPELRQRLLDTGNATLVEGNTWNDTTWGVCRGRGKNWLGRILMQVRSEIRDEEDT
jgi:ribA/ribD-fused uncharacterized protein